MKGYRKYFGKKLFWFFITFLVAVVLNFALPRMMPGDPVAVITAKTAQGIADTNSVKRIYEDYARKFGTNEPVINQFIKFCQNAIKGDFGLSFSQYPRPVSDIVGSAIWWTVGLQLPAIITGWLVGNLLGALAAYIRKGFDKVLMPICLFISSIPAFGMAVILLIIFSIKLGITPTAGG
ncbi:MAG: ABC transporter permease, partial [Angelakisella sp.]